MSNLTAGDWLFLNRKRRKKSPEAEAKRWKLDVDTYMAMENGTKASTIKHSPLNEPTAKELEAILKRPGRVERKARKPKAAAKPAREFRKGDFKARGFHRPGPTIEVPPARVAPKRHTLHTLSTCAIRTLTAGETLVLYRRRLDESQSEAADRLGVGRKLYALMELDLKTIRGAIPTIETVADHEIAFILRRRAGLTRADMVTTGLNRTWVTAMERGDMDCTPLLDRLRELGLINRKL